MSELRQDRTTGDWVIVAPERGRRPQAGKPNVRRKLRPRFDPDCPFCPGNEARLPGVIAETAADGAPGWRVRIVPNKYPAVRLDAPAPAGGDRQYVQPGKGTHQVIIESPWHDAELATMSADEATAVVGAYRERSRLLLAQDGVQAVILFCNRGRDAGASLLHPHAQIVALAVVPPKVAAMDDWARRYTQEHGRCALCDALDAEHKDGARIVDENDGFVVLVPFAAQHPCELWIVPKDHQASFAALADGALGDFAALLARALRRLKTALADPPYNLVIDSAPRDQIAAPHWHWRLRLVPDLVTWGGFELGSGLPINPSSPEEDARLLRAADSGP
jgi:UDPglucose--hexose-1-phosphate uridylyltransferase